MNKETMMSKHDPLDQTLNTKIRVPETAGYRPIQQVVQDKNEQIADLADQLAALQRKPTPRRLTITDERREELIETLEAIGGHLSGDTTFALLRKIDARDILAMLREVAATPNHAAFVSEVKAYMQKASIPLTITFRPYDPPQPETLADVPDWCVVEGQDGRLYFRKGEDVWLLGEENPLDIKPLADEPNEIKITRVLGYPELNSNTT